MSKRDITRKFDEIVAFAELEKFIDTPVKHYSSGMYVRLAFAVAAHLDPEFLLSHQLNQIRRLCHRVIWVDDGQIRQVLP
jgi:ABC-type polysaccharide/polyol phosphate transport system ATPase subunit